MELLFVGGLGLFELLLVFFVFVVPFVFWLYTLIQIIQSNFKDSNDKIIWLIVVILLPFIGLILYYLLGRKKVVKNYNRQV